MKAVLMRRTGGPDVLAMEDVPPPRPPRGQQVLVQVAGSSVNGTDLVMRRGAVAPLTWGQLPWIPGFDLSGTVTSCGPAVTAFVPGDRVLGLLGHGGGALAEHVVVEQSRLAIAPSTVALTDAAALPLAGLTALQALHARAHLHARGPGTRVLVIGATGGIGSYAVQLAALAGARVSALARRDTLAAAQALGAHELLAREDDPLAHRSRPSRPGSTHAHRFDVVIDTAGALTAQQVPLLLRPGGTVVSVRPFDLRILHGTVTGFLRRRRIGDQHATSVTAVSTKARAHDLARLVRLVDSRRLQLPIQAVVTAADCPRAHRLAESPTPGKVVISMPPSAP